MWEVLSERYGENAAGVWRTKSFILSAEIRESFTEVVALKWTTGLPLETSRREF